METLQYLLTGFAGALTPTNLAFAFIGCVLGTLIGVLPASGPSAGTAILIPLTFKLDPTGAIIMLCAIYYGAMYGGTITSVLINVPGEAASVVTCLDGYQMARQGRGGTALGIAAIGSFVGGSGGHPRAHRGRRCRWRESPSASGRRSSSPSCCWDFAWSSVSQGASSWPRSS